ncbi:hypothetical protein FACS1894199_02820 [Bacteroidia bacterium]|nr:hypothetical protein FACS1894199_02820 [Bacteroidia bacterium]
MAELIDFTAAKDKLLQVIQSQGYTQDKEKSCANWLVFRYGGDRIIVPQNYNYTLFYNPNIPADKGDVVDFIRHRLNGGIDTTIPMQGNKERVQNTLQQAACFVPTQTIPIEKPKINGQYHYNITPLDSIPLGVSNLLKKRGINPELLAIPDIANEIGILHSPNGDFKNLFFHWRNINGEKVGGQYKYLTQTGGTIKAFTGGTSRHNSVWATSLEGKSAVFVCEDPIDALSYRQLYPHKNYALLATGGSITAEQAQIIRDKARQANIPIILGNDNDIAGQVSNLRIVDDTAKILGIDALNQTTIIELPPKGKEQIYTCQEMQKLILKIIAHSPKPFILSVPKNKDWNDDLRSIPQKTVRSAALQTIQKINEMTRPKGEENNIQKQKNTPKL